MTAHASRFAIGAPEPAPEPQGPTIFVRTFSTPPGMPWDQSRVAMLEARSGAPLPLADVVYQLRRLDPWSVGRAARYAAFYVRSREVDGDLQSTVDVNGRPMRVRFMSNAQRSRRARRLGLLAAVTGGVALAVSGALASAWAVRAEAAARLDALERIAAPRLRIAKQAERERLMAQSLDAAGVSSLRLGNVLADLAWAAGAKTPGAHIEAFHWDHGHIAVEVRGDGAPFLPGRPLVKAAKPIRLRVWLWGVGRPAGLSSEP